MFNISPLLNAPKIEKTENGVEGYKTPFRTQTAGISISRAKIAQNSEYFDEKISLSCCHYDYDHRFNRKDC